MQSEYKKFIDEKILEISKERYVVDIGGGKRFQKWMARYEDLFKDCDYKTLDGDAKTNPDIVGDIHHLPFLDGSVDAIICSSVLEHVENPILAIKEMHRVLKPGGKIFVYVPSIYPYHARGASYNDYWRFFEDTVRILFADFPNYEIIKHGGYFRALSLFFPAQHRLRFILSPLSNLLDIIFRTNGRTTTAGYYIYAIK